MSTHFTLNEDQRDCLQEVINVAIGRAGDVLARYLEVFVRLSVPRIQLIEARHLPGLIQGSPFYGEQISAVRQGFSGVSGLAMRGEGIAIYNGASFREMTQLLGYGESDSEASEEELLCDISSLLVGNCLNNIAQQFGGDVTFSSPSPLLLQRPLHELTEQLTIEWEAALCVEIRYALENGTFQCSLVLLMPSDTIVKLGAQIDRMLEAM